MEYEWDEEKRLANLRKHGIDFADVWQVFENETSAVIDERFDYGENRFFTLGLLHGRVVAVSYTLKNGKIRIISVRKANKNEQAKYFKEIAD